MQNNCLLPTPNSLLFGYIFNTLALLVTYFHRLCLPTFLKNYRPFAVDASRNDLDYPRYLKALAEQEVIKQEHNTV